MKVNTSALYARMSPSRREELFRILRSWERWRRLRQAISWGLRGMLFSLGVALGISLIGIIQGKLLREEYLLLIAVVTLPGALVAAALAYVWPFSRLRSARYFDRVFGLHERTSTALELAEGEVEPSVEASSRVLFPKPPQSHQRLVSQLWIEGQLADTLAAARLVQPRAQLPIQWKWSELLVAGLLIAGVILVWVRGDAYFQSAYQKRAIQTAISQLIPEIEALRNQIKNDPILSTQQREALVQPLDKALEQLRNALHRDPPSMEQALSALHSAEEQLKILSKAQAEKQAQALQEVGKSLNQAGDGPLRSFSQSLAGESYLEAAQKLANIDPGNLSEEDAQEMTKQLEEIASRIQAYNPDLARTLSQAARALHQGEIAAAQQAIQQASQILSQIGQEIYQAQSAGQAAAMLSESQDRLVQAGRSASAGNQASTGQAGNRGSGQESSSQPGQQGSGGGAGRGEGNGEAGAGSEAGDHPIGQDNAPGDGGERAFEPIYAPQRLGGSDGEDIRLPSSQQPGDQTLGQGNSAPGVPGESFVPYTELLPFYEQIYRQAIDSGRVPLPLRELVRRYFSSLQP